MSVVDKNIFWCGEKKGNGPFLIRPELILARYDFFFFGIITHYYLLV